VKNKHSETLQKEETKRKATETLEIPPKRIKIAQPENNDDDDVDERDNDEGNEKTNDFKCNICNINYKELYNLNKHIKNVHEEKSLKCNNCSYATNDIPSMQRHVESCKKRRREEDVVEQDAKRAREEVHSYNQGPIEDVPSDNTETCFGGTLQTKIWKHRGSKDIVMEMENYKGKCMRSAWYHLKKNRGIIFHTTLKVTLFKTNQDGEDESRPVYIRGKNRRMLDISEFEDLYDDSKNKIWLTFDEWLKDGSGWRIQSMDEFILKICKYTPMQGSSYLKSPNKIENSMSVVNIKNEDNKCFLYSILAKLHPVEKHTERVLNYEPYLEDLNTNGISMPMRLQQIPKFEKQNDLTINVYMTDRTGDDIYPVYISKKRGNDPINLLLLSDGEKSHYTLIKNFDRLLGKGSLHQKVFCPYARV